MRSRFLKALCLACALRAAGLAQSSAPAPTQADRDFAAALIALPPEQAMAAIAAAPPLKLTPAAAVLVRNKGNEFIDKQPAASMPFYLEAQAIAEKAGNDEVKASVGYNVGTAYRLTGSFETAREQFEKSLALYVKLGAPADTLAKLHSPLGVVKMHLGDMEAAQQDMELAYSEYSEVGDEVGMARTLNNLGNVAMALTHFTEARNRYEQSLQLARKHNQRQGEAFLVNNIANSYLQQNNPELAVPYALEAVRLKEEIGDREDLVTSLISLTRVYDTSRREKDALDTIARALAVSREIKDPNALALTLAEWATLDQHSAHYAQALGKLTEGIEYMRQVHDHMHENEMLAQIAEAELGLEHYDDAIRDASAVIDFAERAGVLLILEQASYTRAMAYLKLGSLEAAAHDLQTAIASVERMRDETAGGTDSTLKFFSHHAMDYQALVDVAARQKRWDDAFLTSEREKGRALLDLLTRGRASFGSELSAAERQEEATLQHRLASAGEQRTGAALAAKPDAQKIAAAERQLDAARSAMDCFRERMFAAHPQLERRQGHASLITLAQTTDLVRDSAAALEFEVTADNVYLFTVTGSESGPVLHSYALGLSPAEMSRRIRHFVQQLQSHDPGFSATSLALYRQLLGPAARDIAHKRSLIIVPSGELWRLPFQALANSPGHYLAQATAISYVPSLSVLAAYNRARSQEAPRLLLAFGNPGRDLPEAETEVRAVAALYGPGRSSAYLQKEASLENFRSVVGSHNQHEVLLATHGVYDDHDPMSSYLLLAGGKGSAKTVPLDASQITEMQLRSPLVVLSACETARGRYQAGEGLIGLGWSFLAAGSHTAIASQWRVDSASTTQLMIAFHRALRSHASTAEALRRAELTVANDARYRHPYYWAGFILLGEG